MHGRITLNWPGGEHDFRLAIGNLRAVQETLNEGPMQTLSGLIGLTAKVDAPFVVLRQGLIGAGMPEFEARRLVEAMADHHAWASFIAPAAAVMRAALSGVEGDPAGEPAGAMTPPPNN